MLAALTPILAPFQAASDFASPSARDGNGTVMLQVLLRTLGHRELFDKLAGNAAFERGRAGSRINACQRIGDGTQRRQLSVYALPARERGPWPMAMGAVRSLGASSIHRPRIRWQRCCEAAAIQANPSCFVFRARVSFDACTWSLPGCVGQVERSNPRRALPYTQRPIGRPTWSCI